MDLFGLAEGPLGLGTLLLSQELPRRERQPPSQRFHDPDTMEIYETDVIPIDDTDDAMATSTAQTPPEHDRSNLDVSPTTGMKRKTQYITETDEAVYGASRFGHFGEYMRRKRAKLQIQNASMDTDTGGEGKSDIFKGISVYVRACILLHMPGRSSQCQCVSMEITRRSR